jgi:serine protease Do
MFKKVVLFIPIILSIQFATAPANAKETKGSLAKETKLVEDSENAFVELAERVKPMIVNISPLTETPQSPDSGEGPPDSPEDRTPEDQGGSGSGVIIDKRGFIVTNDHVVGNAEEVEVGLFNRTSFTGKVVGKDPESDLALVKIDAGKDLPFVTLGDSTKIKVGQWAVAVGDPFGLDRSVTVGVVSAVGRENSELSPFEDFIQTDASINPGNSGGPLLNVRGEVIGINTAIIPFAERIGFAIPSNVVQTVAEQLMAHGKVTRAWLGIGVQLWTPALAAKFGVREGEGLLVSEVDDGSPASSAGIEPGDVLLTVDGRIIDSPNSLARAIGVLAPGRKAEIEILRDGKEKTALVEMGEKRDKPIQANRPEPQKSFLGLNVEDLTPDLAKRFMIKEDQGVVVTKVEPGSAADAEGLKEGDLIREINREKVDRSEEFRKIVERSKADGVLLRIVREGRAFFVVLNPKGS